MISAVAIRLSFKECFCPPNHDIHGHNHACNRLNIADHLTGEKIPRYIDTLALQSHPVCRKLPWTGREPILDGLARALPEVHQGIFDVKRFLPLLKAIRDNKSDDCIWSKSRWPDSAKEAPVLAWLKEVISIIIQFFKEYVSDKIVRRRPLVQPYKLLKGSTAKWKLDISFIDRIDPLKDDKSTLVVKDLWQYPERDEEGELLYRAMEKGVINIARYYHHETIQVRGRGNDICDGVRRRLDIITASNYKQASPRPPLSKGESSQATSRKRSSTSRVALLAALEGCIDGYESLYQASILQRDISPNNLMINEDKESASWKAFIIDLDLAINKDREDASGV
ncbi:FunK1 protein kinase [Trichophyton equinum CBS 127.97]|uniref:FunK1 protein kinase n=1 Tax=Trichophyton equinum (strain ATCC MYA-4606 / CBS 127.97) TaxID=559882 RepID=F2PXP9_TRIEC|nr:FunK1 protein kinase [Trichophyton equinum CBS 127.97]